MRTTMIARVLASLVPIASAFIAPPLEASDGGRAEAAVEAFIAEKKTSHEARHRALVGRSLLGAYDLNLDWVLRNSSYLPPALMAANPVQRDGIQNAYLVDLAQSLTGLGWSTAGIEAAQSSGHSILDSLSLVTRGGATSEDFVAVADTVLIARATAVGNRPTPEDGFRSSLRFVVDDVIKGDYRKGEKVVVRQASGPTGDGTVVTLTSDTTTHPGRLYLIVGSANWYEQLASENGSPPGKSKETALVTYGGIVEVGENSPAQSEVQLLRHAARSTVDRLRAIADDTPVH